MRSAGRRLGTRAMMALVPGIPVLSHDAVLAAVVPARRPSSARARPSCATTRGAWTMPPKVYLDSPAHGDFRAMPARGDGWRCSSGSRRSPATPGTACRP